MMNAKQIVIISMVAVLAGACSSSQKNEPPEDYLATHIQSDGSKEFYYTVTLPEGQGSKRGGGKNTHGSARVSGGSSSNTRASAGITMGGSGGKGGGRSRKAGANQDGKVVALLEKELEKTGYCREGWVEQERVYQPTSVSVRGECNDTANDRDLKNFPNTEDTLESS